VLTSTAIRADNNVCFVSGTRGMEGRSTTVIGLVQRPTMGWAVLIKHGDHPIGEVRRTSYRANNYDSFGALSAAEISWVWVTSGRLPEGLTFRLRRR
jgi:hypothetical protein